MAQYTILTTRTREAALKYAYEHQADTTNVTQQQFFQERINIAVLDQMVTAWDMSKMVAVDASFRTIPEANQSKAQAEMEAVIIDNGGTIVHAGDAPTAPPLISPPVPPGIFRGGVQVTRAEGSPAVQNGPANQTTTRTSRPDGGGDN